MLIDSKNILNPTRTQLLENSGTVSENKSLTITDDTDNVNISVPKFLIQTLTPFELSNLILSFLAPIFHDDNSTPQKQFTNNKISNFKHIAFFIEHMPHYTGGRYSIYQQAVLLSQYTKVTVVTNQMPPFYQDFKDYYTENFNIVLSIDFLIKESDNNFDLIVGCPVKGGVMADIYSKKFNLPLYLILFESPNWVSLYRDGVDGDENFWAEYKTCLLRCNKIMVPSYESKKYLWEWLKSDARIQSIGESDIEVVYPCMNQVVADKVKNRKINIKNKNKKYNIVYISRMISGKSMLPIFKKFKKSEYHFDLIGKIWSDQKIEIESLIKKGYDITIHDKLNDENKFKILAVADALAFPTKFEGFGMPPMEALYFNIPVVAYELPVLKEIYGNRINYVPVGDSEAFVHKIMQVCTQKTHCDALKVENKCIDNSKSNDFSLIKTCSQKLNEIFDIPKITVGIIVYNGDDYIEYVIRSIYDVVSQIIIVDGSVKGYGAEKPYSTDNTLKIVKKLKKEIDLLDKIELIENNGNFYKDKVTMQNVIASKVTGDYYVKMDADEIWKKETLIDAIQFMAVNNIELLKMPFYHFWLSFNTVAVDHNGKWSTKHPRIWKWKKGYCHKNSFNYFIDNNGIKVAEPNVIATEYTGDRIYHFGYVRKLSVLMQKLRYYKTRGIEKYHNNTVIKWKKLSDPTQPTQISDSYAETFMGILPEILNKHPYYEVKDIRGIK